MSTRPGSSSGGSVSGGQARHVTPPATAAFISDSSVALYSKPGSRKRADRSIKPGATTCPLASIVRLAVHPAGAWPIAAILPAATKSEVAAGKPFAHVVMDLYSHRLHRRGQQRFRSDRADLGRAERGEPVDQRARDSRVQHVADDCDRQLAEILLVVTNGEEVEKALCR